MSSFEESNVRRGNGGRFAEKPAAPEASGVALDSPVEPVSAALTARGWSADAATPDPDGHIRVSVLHSGDPDDPGEHGASVAVGPSPDGTWTMSHSSWQRDPDSGVVDGETVNLESGMDEERAAVALADYVDAANDSSEFDEPFDVYRTQVPAGADQDDPWAAPNA